MSSLMEHITRLFHVNQVMSKYKFRHIKLSAVLTTGQTGRLPGPSSCRSPELQGSGNFLLFNVAVKILIGFLALILLHSTSLPLKIIFCLCKGGYN